jgi:hypothetical protein
MAPPSSLSASSTPLTTLSPLGTRPGPRPISSSTASTAPARSPLAQQAASRAGPSWPANPGARSAAAQSRASTLQPWSSRARDSGPNTGDGSHQRTIRISSPHATTRSSPAQHSADACAWNGPVTMAFGSLMASGGEMAMTRGSGTTSVNSR